MEEEEGGDGECESHHMTVNQSINQSILNTYVSSSLISVVN